MTGDNEKGFHIFLYSIALQSFSLTPFEQCIFHCIVKTLKIGAD